MDNLRRFVLVFTVVIFFTIAICGFVLAKNYYEISKKDNVVLESDGTVFDPNAKDNLALDDFNENILLVVGDKEINANTVGVRSRVDGDIGSMKTEDFIEKILEEITK